VDEASGGKVPLKRKKERRARSRNRVPAKLQRIANYPTAAGRRRYGRNPKSWLNSIDFVFSKTLA